MSSVFVSRFLVIKTLYRYTYPDPDALEKLDPDPYPDPQH
jgi:hypothetical protein